MERKINSLYEKIKEILEKNNHNVNLINNDAKYVKYVKDFLIDNRYLIRIEMSDEKIPIGVQYYNYLISFCCIENFDRWANSGWTEGYDYEKDILTVFEDDSLWITFALADSLSDIIDDCKFKNDYSNLEKIKKMFLGMLKEI